MTYKVFYNNQEFHSESQILATAAYRLMEENSDTSYLSWLEEFGAEGITFNDLSTFDFSKTCDAVKPDEVSYIIDCPDVDNKRFYYVGTNE